MSRPAFEKAWAIIANAVPDSFDELRAVVPPRRHDDISVLAPETPAPPIVHRRPGAEVVMPSDAAGRVLAIRKASNASWSNLRKAIAALSDLPHEPFGTVNVENTSKSIVRRMSRETGLSLVELSRVVESLAGQPEPETAVEGAVAQ